MLMKFFDVVLITVVIYLPTFIGKYKKSEESLFWASLISSILTVISFFLVENGEIRISTVDFLALGVSTLFGLGAYTLYRINHTFSREKVSVLTWLVTLPFVDTMILRKYGIGNLLNLDSLHQLLLWYVPTSVIVMALVGGVIYFLIFSRNGWETTWWEGSIAFVLGLVSGYIYLRYGFLTAVLSQCAFNVWRVLFAKSVKT